MDPSFGDAELTRFHLGHEREPGTACSAGADLVCAEGDKLPTNIDINRTRLDGQLALCQPFGAQSVQAPTPAAVA